MKFFYLITAALLAVLLSIGHASAVPITGSISSGTGNCGDYTPSAVNRSVVLFGDSITMSGKTRLQELRPNWEINGLGGRNVDCLPMLVSERLKKGYLGKLVIALGTNATEGWGQEQYQEVVDMVKPNTVVVFVNTYRDPDIYNEANGYNYRSLASTQYWYSKYMANIASSNTGVCVAPWRQTVQAHPSLLHDGTHPTATGREWWANLVADTTGDCS